MTPAPTKPTPSPSPSPQAKLNAYRFAGAAVALAITALLEWFAAGWSPILRSGIELAIGAVYGKLFGVPLKQVFESALRRDPAAALGVATTALASLPPEHAERAAQDLFASLPPDARARASLTPDPIPGAPAVPVITFVGASDVPPMPPRDPTGRPIIVRTSPPSAASMTGPSGPEGGHGVPDDSVMDAADDEMTAPRRVYRRPPTR